METDWMVIRVVAFVAAIMGAESLTLVFHHDLALPFALIDGGVFAVILLLTLAGAAAAHVAEVVNKRMETALRESLPQRLSIADGELRVWRRPVGVHWFRRPNVGEEALVAAVELEEVQYGVKSFERRHGLYKTQIVLWDGRPSTRDLRPYLVSFDLDFALDTSADVVHELAEHLRPERESYRLSDYDRDRWPAAELSLAQLRVRDPRPVTELP